MLILHYNDAEGKRKTRTFRNEKSLDVWTKHNTASIIKIVRRVKN